jgi:hypothetical protein
MLKGAHLCDLVCLQMVRVNYSILHKDREFQKICGKDHVLNFIVGYFNRLRQAYLGVRRYPTKVPVLING